jgi:hypothetical protein
VRFPTFDLPRAGGGRLTDADLVGRPWIAYVSRHPGCMVCQDMLGKALRHRPAVQALGGDIAVFFQADPAYVDMWFPRSTLPPDLPVASDPDAGLYRDLGTMRASWRTLLLGSPRPMIEAWRNGYRPTASGQDYQRMGADVAVTADGEVALLHVCKDATDRVPTADLVAAIS